MGMYIWIALGAFVGVVARLLTPKRLNPSWIAHLCVGIAGALAGGWIATRVWNSGVGINNMDVPAMVGAIVGAVVLLAIYLGTIHRNRPAVSSKDDEDLRRIA